MPATQRGELLETQALVGAKPLFALSRGEIPEIVIHGHIFWKTEGEVAQGTDAGAVVISRSLLKPWQFLAAEVAGTDSFWAMGLASHSGQPDHIEQLKQLAAAAHVTEEELFCPRSLPLDGMLAAQMKLQQAKPARLFHPCSGKHLMILAACRKFEFSLHDYWNEEHPFQRRLYQMVGNQAGERHSWVTDSCGVPTLAARGPVHLNLWEKLAVNSGENFDQLRHLWTQNPRLVGGAGRLDSDLVTATEGGVLAKEGADGLLMLQSLPGNGGPVATCLIKLAGGYNPAFLALALWAFLNSDRIPVPESFGGLKEYLRSRWEEWVPRDQQFMNLLS